MTKGLIAVVIVAVLAVAGFLLVSGDGTGPGGGTALAPEDPLGTGNGADVATTTPEMTAAPEMTEAPDVSGGAGGEALATAVAEGADALRDALTVENFDFETVVGAIEAAPLDEARKDALVSMLATAGEDPSQLSLVLDEVRAELLR